MDDKTSYTQSLTHLIKGNLGAGILAMPATFAHTGLMGAIIGLPVLCLVCAYCVHALVKSSHLIGSRTKGAQVSYSNLARQSVSMGPEWFQGLSETMGRIVDGFLLITQMGVCCVYVIFLVDNVTSILASFRVHVPKSLAFIALFPLCLMLSFIRTLKRLSLASLVANLLQVVGLALIIEFLIRDLDQIDLKKRDNIRPLSEVALGFGAAIFSFEGISVVLPVYSRMRNQQRMSSCFGAINTSFVVILVLNLVVGLLGYLKFGHHVKDSITLNLPSEPLYEAVRAMFTASILLSYPLQLYAPIEIIWEWARDNLLGPTKQELSVIRAIEVVIPQQGSKIIGTSSGTKQLTFPTTEKTKTPMANGVLATDIGTKKINPLEANISLHKEKNNGTTTATTLNQISMNQQVDTGLVPTRYQYYCRFFVVALTFTLAFSVPKLNLLMDFFGSFSGVALSLTLPAIIHLTAFWNHTEGFSKAMMVILDTVIILVSFAAGIGGSLSSLVSIANSFH